MKKFLYALADLFGAFYNIATIIILNCGLFLLGLLVIVIYGIFHFVK